MTTASNGNKALAILCVLGAVVCAALAVFYATQATSFLASEYGHHYRHAILFAGLTVVALVAANFVRPKSS